MNYLHGFNNKVFADLRHLKKTTKVAIKEKVKNYRFLLNKNINDCNCLVTKKSF